MVRIFCDPERKDNILGRNETRLELWEEHLKDPIVALDKTFDVWLRILVKDDFWLETSTHWNVPKKSGSHGELFFFLLKKEPMVLSELVEFGPSTSAETVTACALIDLHMMASENAPRSDRDSSPDLGEMCKFGCPRGSVWSGDGFEGAKKCGYFIRGVSRAQCR